MNAPDRPRKGFNPASDEAAADRYMGDSQLMCAANRCPNRWSLSSSKLCSAHAWVDPKTWPAVTQGQLDLQAQIAFDAQRPKPAPKPVDRQAIRKSARAMASNLSGTGPVDGTAWARKLRQRERDGSTTLTQFQRDAWRAVLGPSLHEEHSA